MAPALPSIDTRGKDQANSSRPPMAKSNRPPEITGLGSSSFSHKKQSPRPGSGGKVQLAPLASPRGTPDVEQTDNHLDKSADKYLQCVDMLVNGYVQSFVDFFYLTHKSEGGGEGPPYTIEEDEEEEDGPLNDLRAVKANLCKAEAAKRRGDSREVYSAYRSLGRQFEEGNDVKTAIYFYEKCLEVAKLTEDDELEAEANNDLGLAYEKIGNISTAITFHEQHLKISGSGQEETVTASPDKAAARAHLVEAYRTFASECEERGDLTQAVEFHEKCLEAAKTSLDVHAEALAYHRLGLALKKLGNITEAISNQRKYLDMCASNNDGEGQGNACAAIAEALEENGDVQGAIKYLEQFLDVSQNTGHLAQQGNACRRLGAIYNKMGNFNTAVHYFEKNFEIARSIGDRVLIDNARADLGVARGNAKMTNFMELLTKNDISTLLRWKNRRIAFSSEEGI